MTGIITCEESQEVTKAFRSKGHAFYSNDILDCTGGHEEWHWIKPISESLLKTQIFPGKTWDFIGAHPPCTYTTNSGVRWLYNKDGSKNLERWKKLEESMNFFNMIKRNIKTGYLENPIPHKYARDGFYSVVTGQWVEGIGKYTQLIQPWQFGHGETKATCLWLINLPELKPTDIVEGREQKIWKMPPSKERQKLRSKTYHGIAKAMAQQWG